MFEQTLSLNPIFQLSEEECEWTLLLKVVMSSYPWSRNSHVQLCADADAHNLVRVSVQNLHWFRRQTHRSSTLQTWDENINNSTK